MSFNVPLFTGVRLYNSILARMFFYVTVSGVLCNTIPTPKTVILFYILLKVFTVNTPNMPKNAIVTSLNVVANVLGFNSSTATLVLAVFTLRSDFKATYGMANSNTLALVLAKCTECRGVERRGLRWGFGVPSCLSFFSSVVIFVFLQAGRLVYAYRALYGHVRVNGFSGRRFLRRSVVLRTNATNRSFRTLFFRLFRVFRAFEIFYYGFYASVVRGSYVQVYFRLEGNVSGSFSRGLSRFVVAVSRGV